MKIAAITEDGVTISRHFGRAPYYAVLTIEDAKITSREQRDKLGHAHFSREEQAAGHHSTTHSEAGHGFDPASQDRHARMAGTISDCEVLLSGGMGAGAYASLQQAGIRPILTDIRAIEEAVAAYLDGTIVDHTERLH